MATKWLSGHSFFSYGLSHHVPFIAPLITSSSHTNLTSWLQSTFHHHFHQLILTRVSLVDYNLPFITPLTESSLYKNLISWLQSTFHHLSHQITFTHRGFLAPFLPATARLRGTMPTLQLVMSTVWTQWDVHVQQLCRVGGAHNVSVHLGRVCPTSTWSGAVPPLTQSPALQYGCGQTALLSPLQSSWDWITVRLAHIVSLMLTSCQSLSCWAVALASLRRYLLRHRARCGPRL